MRERVVAVVILIFGFILLLCITVLGHAQTLPVNKLPYRSADNFEAIKNRKLLAVPGVSQNRVVYRFSNTGVDNCGRPNTFQATYKPLYKIYEVCNIFQVAKPTIYDWIKHGILKPFKVKSRVYFLSDDIEKCLQILRIVADENLEME